MSRKAGSLSIVLIATATVSLVCAGPAAAQYGAGSTQKKSTTSTSRATSGVSAADKKFLTDAAQGGEAEVELGKLAQQKAADAKVNEFGARMEADHSKATSELRALIVSKGITVPGGLGPHLALKNRLDKLQGAAFDQAYMKAMVDDHIKDVHAFEMEAKTTKDTDIKTFVEKTLPTLREHLKMAQDTYKAVSSTMRTSSNAR
jgi:putative membrane protein